MAFLSPEIPEARLFEIAEGIYQNSDLAEYHFKRELEVSIDNDLSVFAQFLPDSDTLKHTLPVVTADFSWQGKVKKKNTKKGIVTIEDNSSKGESEESENYLKLSLDFRGRLRNFEKKSTQLAADKDFTENAVLHQAKLFLVKTGYDTSLLSLTEKRTNTSENNTIYDFTFQQTLLDSPAVRENIEIHFEGAELTEFRSKFDVGKAGLLAGKLSKISETALAIVTGLVWIIIIIFLVITFFKRLKHDELEFKHALGVAVFAALVMFAGITAATWPSWEGVLLGGGFSGIFVGLGVMLIFAVSESYARDVWPEKIQLSDVLFRGIFKVRELGAAILNSFFITGVSLFYFGAAIWLTGKFDWGVIHTDSDQLLLFSNALKIAGVILRNTAGVLFTILIIGLFGAAYLKFKLKSRRKFIAFLSFIILFGGLYSFFIKPEYISLLIFIPVALLWAVFIVRFEVVTLTLSLFGIYNLLDLSFLPIIAQGVLSETGLLLVAFCLVFGGTGAYLLYRGQPAADFENYIPEYVSRIAERERFLQELEIARTIQMKFLPQTPPSCRRLDIASVCKPAMEIGGDYFDFIRDGDDHLSIIIGDVSGKGVSAAFYMTMAKGILKTVSKKVKQPGQLLSEVNEIFYENAPRNVFISIVYGYFDLTNQTLTFARAGHNPVIVRKKAMVKPELLSPNGLAIGLERGDVFSKIKSLKS
ncbi:MAG: PP2C family protein-serine/threonine phosphatase [Calditrichia bacterium]